MQSGRLAVPKELHGPDRSIGDPVRPAQRNPHLLRIPGHLFDVSGLLVQPGRVGGDVFKFCIFRQKKHPVGSQFHFPFRIRAGDDRDRVGGHVKRLLVIAIGVEDMQALQAQIQQRRPFKAHEIQRSRIDATERDPVERFAEFVRYVENSACGRVRSVDTECFKHPEDFAERRLVLLRIIPERLAVFVAGDFHAGIAEFRLVIDRRRC